MTYLWYLPVSLLDRLHMFIDELSNPRVSLREELSNRVSVISVTQSAGYTSNKCPKANIITRLLWNLDAVPRIIGGRVDSERLVKITAAERPLNCILPLTFQRIPKFTVCCAGTRKLAFDPVIKARID